MNYRHAFHAGNFADVIKHIILTRIICYLQKKDKAFRIIDTHAGIGLYDLTSEQAHRSPEWEKGIKRLMEASLCEKTDALIAPYLSIIRNLNKDMSITTYPGSPLISRHLMRQQDRLTAIELHPQDFPKLQYHFQGDVQVKAIHLDGWQAMVAHVPPKEKRGLVLVDPPFEKPDEFSRMVDGLQKAHRRFSSGIYALWYPVKDVNQIDKFAKQLRETGIKKILRIEFNIVRPTNPPTMHGTGMIVVNPPFTLYDELTLVLKELQPILAPQNQGKVHLSWIRGE